MSEQTPDAPAALTPDTPAALTPEQAAKAVRRKVPEIKDGKPTGQTALQAIRPDEVLASVVRGNVVTVVTISGEKLSAELPAKAAK